jgi:hypothetical protein
MAIIAYCTTAETQAATTRLSGALNAITAQISAGGKELSSGLNSEWMAIYSEFEALILESSSIYDQCTLIDKINKLYDRTYAIGEKIKGEVGVPSGITAREGNWWSKALKLAFWGTVVYVGVKYGPGFIKSFKSGYSRPPRYATRR